MRIGIMTAAGQGNLGDELILRQELAHLRKRFPGAAFTVFTYARAPHLLDRVSDIRFVEYFPNGLRRRPLHNLSLAWANWREIGECDLLVVGGGGIFFTKENGRASKAMWHWAWRIATAKWHRVPVTYLALGASLTTAEFKKWRWLFSGKNTKISVREPDAQRRLIALGFRPTLVPDPVFTLDKPTIRKGGGRVGLALREGMLPDEKDAVSGMVEYLVGRGYEPVLICHSAHPDDPSCDDRAFLLPIARKYGLSIAQSNEEALASYAFLDFVVAMRLHSAILAVRYGVPFLALSYSNKTDELLARLRWPHALAAKSFDLPSFMRAFERLEGAHGAALLDLEAQSRRMASSFENVFPTLFSHVGQD